MWCHLALWCFIQQTEYIRFKTRDMGGKWHWWCKWSLLCYLINTLDDSDGLNIPRHYILVPFKYTEVLSRLLNQTLCFVDKFPQFSFSKILMLLDHLYEMFMHLLSCHFTLLKPAFHCSESDFLRKEICFLSVFTLECNASGRNNNKEKVLGYIPAFGFFPSSLGDL